MTKEYLSKISESKTPRVYKNKKLNNANFDNFNHNDYQVFLYLVSKIKGTDEYGKYLQPECLQKKYLLTAKEFSEVFDVSLSNCYDILRKAADKLIKIDIRIEKSDNSSFCRINICSMVEYNRSKGSMVINLTDHVMPYLAQVKAKFILYNLKEISNFGSLYTTRLYELIQEFKETGWIIKSINQLKELFSVGNKYKLYGHFKAKTFGHACQEINDNYEMNLTFDEIKEGRKVEAIKFSFKKTKICRVVNHETGKQQNIYEKPALKSKIIESSMGQLHSSMNAVKKIGDVTSNLPIFKNIGTS